MHIVVDLVRFYLSFFANTFEHMRNEKSLVFFFYFLPESLSSSERNNFSNTKENWMQQQNVLSNSRNKILFIWEKWSCDCVTCNLVALITKNEPNTMTLKNSYMHLEVNSIWQGLIDVNILIWHSQQAILFNIILLQFIIHNNFLYFNIFLFIICTTENESK
jgi:hypothetical protein